MVGRINSHLNNELGETCGGELTETEINKVVGMYKTMGFACEMQKHVDQGMYSHSLGELLMCMCDIVTCPHPIPLTAIVANTQFRFERGYHWFVVMYSSEGSRTIIDNTSILGGAGAGGSSSSSSSSSSSTSTSASSRSCGSCTSNSSRSRKKHQQQQEQQ